MYRMRSVYHLRWWIANQALGNGGKGVSYDDTWVDDSVLANAGREDGEKCEMDGVFPLDRASIGKRADVTTSTLLSPAAIIFKDGEIFGPHVSSFGNASDKSSAALNGTPFKKSSMWTLNIVVMFASYRSSLPSMCLMTNHAAVVRPHLNAFENVLGWLVHPQVIRTIAVLSSRLWRHRTADHGPKQVVTKRCIHSILISQFNLKRAFDILCTPRLLEIGDDVVSGTCLEIYTTDRIKAVKIVAGGRTGLMHEPDHVEPGDYVVAHINLRFDFILNRLHIYLGVSFVCACTAISPQYITFTICNQVFYEPCITHALPHNLKCPE
ncbi:hypothetical protein FIBSPDRAFT_931938 [Athelia psychrophila]|uniref:Uncharacterized protein n=1 Tax=Athelia psychrophila TaxID=1759441 RepID=A0A166JIV5_9AGAM|nr:hypothetical protein FIBSPDRAFT_931938 [Fibularhizoctonia sp. CBS 109695]